MRPFHNFFLSKYSSIRFAAHIRLNLPPFVSSLSIGCFSAVMSRNVSRNSTTKSRSFLMGATCSNSHSGVSVKRKTKLCKIFFRYIIKEGGSQIRISVWGCTWTTWFSHQGKDGPSWSIVHTKKITFVWIVLFGQTPTPRISKWPNGQPFKGVDDSFALFCSPLLTQLINFQIFNSIDRA